jgi:hypothetical protein
MSCFATVSQTNGPRIQCYGFPHKCPLLHHVVQADHKVWCHPHSTDHDTPPIAYLISKQVVPYRTRGGTCSPGVSIPKIQSLADLSMTNHFTWRNPTVSTIPTWLKAQHRSSSWANHISMFGRPSLTKAQAYLNIIKDGKTCMTLMTARLSITNQVWTQILNIRLKYSIKACKPMCILEKERAHRINMVKGHLPCSPASCCSKSWTSSSWRI